MLWAHWGIWRDGRTWELAPLTWDTKHMQYENIWNYFNGTSKYSLLIPTGWKCSHQIHPIICIQNLGEEHNTYQIGLHLKYCPTHILCSCRRATASKGKCESICLEWMYTMSDTDITTWCQLLLSWFSSLSCCFWIYLWVVARGLLY